MEHDFESCAYANSATPAGNLNHFTKKLLSSKDQGNCAASRAKYQTAEHIKWIMVADYYPGNPGHQSNDQTEDCQEQRKMPKSYADRGKTDDVLGRKRIRMVV